MEGTEDGRKKVRRKEEKREGGRMGRRKREGGRKKRKAIKETGRREGK